MSRSLLLAGLLAVLGAGGSGQQSGTTAPPSGVVRPLRRQTVVVETSFSTTAVFQQSQTTQVLVPRFDPADGELRAVVVRLDLDYAGQLEVESSLSTPSQANWILQWTVGGSFPGMPFVIDSAGGTQALGPRDGVSCDGGGPDWALLSAASSRSEQLWNTDPGVLGAWKGDPVSMGFALQVNSGVNPFGYCLHANQSLTGRWTITYYYR